MKTKKNKETKYGEPWEWEPKDVFVRDCNGQYIKAEQTERAIQCVNACAGIEDPIVMERKDVEKWINQIRQKAKEITVWLELKGYQDIPLEIDDAMSKFRSMAVELLSKGDANGTF